MHLLYLFHYIAYSYWLAKKALSFNKQIPYLDLIPFKAAFLIIIFLSNTLCFMHLSSLSGMRFHKWQIPVPFHVLQSSLNQDQP